MKPTTGGGLTVKAGERNCQAFKAFSDQRRTAKRRGISFELEFHVWQWLWLASGRWDQRGNRAGDYVMARYGDQGPYAVGNVFFQTVAANAAQGNLGRSLTYPLAKCPHCTRQVPINIMWRHVRTHSPL